MGFLASKAVEHTVELADGARKLKFLPARMRELKQLKALAGRISGAIALAFAPVDYERRSVRDFEGGKESVFEPAHSDEIEAAVSRRAGAFSDLADIVLSDEGHESLATLILGSLREQKEFAGLSATELVDECPADVFVDLLIGFFKANRKILDPLAKTVGDLAGRLKAQLEERLPAPGGDPAPAT